MQPPYTRTSLSVERLLLVRAFGNAPHPYMIFDHDFAPFMTRNSPVFSILRSDVDLMSDVGGNSAL
jgi:hypothetical protein